MKFYRVQISGFGGEVAIQKINKEAFDFWSENEEHLSTYAWADDTDETNQLSEEMGIPIPEKARFMIDDYEEDRSWQDQPFVEQEFAGAKGCINVEVDEVDADDKYIRDILPPSDVDDFKIIETLDTSTIRQMTKDGGYYAQYYSIEKGYFFEGILELDDDKEFDKNKLSFHFEDLIVEEFLYGVMYDGEYINNEGGGDTRGKDFRVDIWDYTT